VAKGCAKLEPRDLGFSPQARKKEGLLNIHRGEMTMTTGRFLTVATLCMLLTGAGFAQATGQTIQERQTDQQRRIAQGVRSGQLTAHETANLERREASVNREEHAMRRADNGHLTAQDKAALNKRQNHISRSIYSDKHNGAVR
jgi:hypothetical protein